MPAAVDQSVTPPDANRVKPEVDEAAQADWPPQNPSDMSAREPKPEPEPVAGQTTAEKGEDAHRAALSEGSTTSKATGVTDDSAVEDGVSQFVDSVVESSAFAVGVGAERDRVQTLINNLVHRVQTPDGDNAAPASAPDDTTVNTTPGVFKAVPYGDVRTWCLANDANGTWSSQGNTDQSASASQEPLKALSTMYWTQNAENLTLTLELTSRPPNSKRDVKVFFMPSSVRVVIYDDVVLDEKLVFPVDADSCLWSLDRADASAPLLTLEFEKARPQWWYTLFVSHDPAAYRVYEPRASRPRVSPTESNRANSQPPPPPPPPFATDASDEELAEQVPPPDDPPPASVDETELDISAPGAGTNGKSTARKSLSGANGVGAKLKSSNGISQVDIAQIIAQYEKALELGGKASGEAALQLASFYHHGVGVKTNVAEALRLYKVAMERGAADSTASFQLGMIYNQGCDGVEKSEEEAVRWWTVSAKLGNPVAMFNLGVMYLNGSGCIMDPTRAIQLFNSAHALNPQLKPPAFTASQLADRVAEAERQKKRRRKEALSPEERKRRHDEAMQTIRYVSYGTLAVVSVSVGAVLVRHWWRNRL